MPNQNAGDDEDAIRSVLDAALALSGDAAKANAWIDVSLPEYQNKSARELVREGRADVVLRHIAQLESGSSG
jgi:uncharacterized protein (DUF2384 family)